MSLKTLRQAQSLEAVAKLLDFTPSGLSYVLYKMPDALKYTTFQILKRNGGHRVIKAPAPQLKLLQRRLANVLYDCVEEIEGSGQRRSLAHGFERGRSITTNANQHKRRRYVLNLDLKDFFPSINFGRVRGFFIKDKNFALSDKTATILAQIACFEHELPQGSPCSPIISNLIGHLLDGRLVRLAKKNKCTYSRYADDITFSTSRRDFPNSLAVRSLDDPSVWTLSNKLTGVIERSGFKVNETKVRMQIRGSRQAVTGLLVNEKVNVAPEYYREIRSMCHQVFMTGRCYRMVASKELGGEVKVDKVEIDSLDKVQGRLSFIYDIKGSPAWRDYSEDKKARMDQRPPALLKLYRKFLFYKLFVAASGPLILTEGKTDPIYLHGAIRRLSQFHPGLGNTVLGKFSRTVGLLRYSRTVQDVLDLGNGSGAFTKLISNYRKNLRSFRHSPLNYPVIVLLDNDDGANGVFNTIRGSAGLSISLTSKESFYYLFENLYLVKTPEAEGAIPDSKIEDFFEEKELKVELGGKRFDPYKEHDAPDSYGKARFAEAVIAPRVSEINFDGFSPLLQRISGAISDYAARRQNGQEQVA